MKPQEINKKIATWLGHTCGEIHIIKDGFIIGLIPRYYNTNAAFDLLDVLVERGYVYELVSVKSDHEMNIYGESIIAKYLDKSKSVAVCEAVTQLIEKEKL